MGAGYQLQRIIAVKIEYGIVLVTSTAYELRPLHGHPSLVINVFI